MRRLRVLFLVAEDWYFWSHRRLLAQQLVDDGCRVDVVTSQGQLRSQIETSGMHWHSVGLSRLGRHPLREGRTVARLARLFRRLRPDVVHLVGLKPILYGTLAARWTQVPATVCAIAGLGSLYSSGGIAKRAARTVVAAYFRAALQGRQNVHFIVQNEQDQELLVSSKMAVNDQVSLIAGAGVDTGRFRYVEESDETPTVLTHCRMLWEKGIGQLVHAARVLKGEKVPCRFLLVGSPDVANPSTIPLQQLEDWNSEGVVQWQPRRDDIPQLLASSHIACLPTYYREGLPLSLVEAAASGRPIVTTNTPGCRDVVRDGENGLLVPPRDVEALVNALRRLLLDPELRQRMGRAGCRRVQKYMSSSTINRQTIACYERALGYDLDLPGGSPEIADMAA